MANGEPNQPSKWLQLFTFLIGGGAGGLIGSLISSYIEVQKIEREAAQEQLQFAQTYLDKVVTQNLDTRVRIAEYFQHILAAKDQRNRWTNYLATIKKKREAWSEEYVELLKKAGVNRLTLEESLRLSEIENYLGETKYRTPGPELPARPPSDVARLLALCAKGQVGVSEDPNRPNRGTRVDEYVSVVGGDPEKAAPWGAALVGWCVKSTGLDQVLPISADASEMWSKAQDKGLAITAADLLKTGDLRVGDIYMITNAESVGIGIVTDVADVPTAFWGIEGDSDPKSMMGGQGFGVFERRLPVRAINRGVIRLIPPPAAAQAPSAQQ